MQGLGVGALRVGCGCIVLGATKFRVLRLGFQGFHGNSIRS